MESTSYSAPRIVSESERKRLDAQKEITPFKRNKLEINACKNWDGFYRRNQDRFFRDRHWTKEEFQEIFSDINLQVS